MLDIDKIFIISDLHFGARNNAEMWAQIQLDYFNNFFIPLVEKEKTEKSIIFFGGDIFDNRSSVNIKIMNEVLELFKRMSSILPIHMITGNHDCYMKSSNDINSIKFLSYLPDVYVYSEPELLKLKNGTKILLMPWQSDVNAEREVLNKYDADILFCHTSFAGTHQNQYIQERDGLDKASTKKFKKIFSGHIHYGQIKDNIILVGCPYSITRNDIGNDKGVYILDTKSIKYKFIKNDYSPKFVKLFLDKMFDMTVQEFIDITRNNFVDIICSSTWSTKFPFSRLLDITTEYRKININIQSDEFNTDAEMDTDISEFNLINLIESYIKSSPYTPQVKKVLKNKINQLYEQASTGIKDE